MSSFIRNTQFLLLLILVVLITMTYHPYVTALTETEALRRGGLLGPAVIAVFFLLFIACFRRKEFFNLAIIRKLWLYVAVLAFFSFIVFAFSSKSMMGDVRAISITIVAIMIGWQLKISDVQWKLVFILYGFLAIFVAVSQSIVNGAGFAIQDQYFAFQKNALGPIIGTAAIGLTQMLFAKKKNKWTGIVLMVLIFIAIAACALIRARAAMLSTVAVIVFMLYKRFQRKGLVLSLLIVLLLIISIIIIAPDQIKQFFYDSMYAGVREGNLDSGRISRNAEALSFIADHLLFGNLNENYVMDEIHYYLLNRVFAYGLFFALPILIVYFNIIIIAIKRGFNVDIDNLRNCGYFALLLPYIVSFAEPTFPFGPGTATVLNFILFGVALRNSYDNRSLTSNKLQLQQV